MATAIIIVSYRTPADVAGCLAAIDRLHVEDEVGVFLVENGGPDAYVALCEAVGALCPEIEDTPGLVPEPCGSAVRHRRCRSFRLPNSAAPVSVAEATENLGYGAGVNSWLEQRHAMSRWTGFWILNPDTAPEPEALSALIAACDKNDGGMAGSVIVDYYRRDQVLSRGLLWRPWLGSVFAVGRGQAVEAPPSAPTDVDAPSGTSIYVTRSCLNAIGLMSEDYFLYFEDVDWGMRAKAMGALRCADASLVPHKHGSSLGSAHKRADRSRLSVYLDTRNMLLFTRRHDPHLLLCVVLRSLMRAFEFLAVGSGGNCASVLSGLAAGVRGECGRPF